MLRAEGISLALSPLIQIWWDHRLHIEQFDQDLIILAGFMRILTKTFTRCFNGKLINIHPSILPKYPGLNTHEKVLLSDDKHHGVTIHYVNEVVDAGAIIAQGILKLPDSPDERKMIDNIHRIEHDLYPKVVSEIIDHKIKYKNECVKFCLLYTSPSPRDLSTSRMPSSA